MWISGSVQHYHKTFDTEMHVCKIKICIYSLPRFSQCREKIRQVGFNQLRCVIFTFLGKALWILDGFLLMASECGKANGQREMSIPTDGLSSNTDHITLRIYPCEHSALAFIREKCFQNSVLIQQWMSLLIDQCSL